MRKLFGLILLLTAAAFGQTTQTFSNVNVKQNLTASVVNGVCQATNQTGADAGAKINNCVTALGSTGGVVDARGFTGAQTTGNNPFNGQLGPITLYLGSATFTASTSWLPCSKTQIIGMGQGISTIKFASAVNNGYVIENCHGAGGDDHITIRNLTLDNNALNQSPNLGAGQRTGGIRFNNVKYFWIEDNEILNAYDHHIDVQGFSQFGWIRNNHIDGSILGSGILIGNGPTSISHVTGTEAYDMFAEGNSISNVGGGDCLFSTGSDTTSAYGTARIHFKNNTLFNCGDVGIEIGDSTRDSEATGNILNIAPSLTITSVVRASNVVTATVSCPWSSTTAMGCLTAFGVGAPFTVAGVTDGTFNLTSCDPSVPNCFTVASVNYAANTFTYAQTAANSTSSGGTITRAGNAALLMRASLNVAFMGNIINGNPIASAQDCEFAWHAAGDNSPAANNGSWNNVCNSVGRNGFTTAADASGTVTQQNNQTKFLNTHTNDYVLSSNNLAVRLLGGSGYISGGNAFAGISFNQSNDLEFRPGSTNFARFVFGDTAHGLLLSNVSGNCTNLFCVSSASGGTDSFFKQTVDGNTNIGFTNTHPQGYALGIRAASSNCAAESFLLRDTQNGVDLMCWGPNGGNAVFTNPVQMPKTFLTAAPPSVAAGQIGYGGSAGFGNGAAGNTVTTTLKGTGSGPTTPQTIVNYIQVNIAGTTAWIPVMQ